MDDTPFFKELIYILQQLGINSENTIKNRPFDYDRLTQWQNDLANTENFGNIIDILKGTISRHGGTHFKPYLHMFLSYAYCAQKSGYDALDHVDYAVKMFEFSENDWDKALAHWFCGILYIRYPGRGDVKQELYEAIEFLQEISIHTQQHDYATKNRCKSVIERIKSTIDHLPVQKPNYSSTPTNLGGHSHSFSESGSRADNRFSQGISPTSGTEKDGFPAINLHVNIPIDVRATNHLDQNFAQHLHNHQEQSVNQTEETFFSPGNPLDINLVDLSEPIALHTPDESDNDEIKQETNIPVGVFDSSYLLTPSLPIYGKVSAGPDGQVVLDEPGSDEVFDESSIILIQGEEYAVYSLRRDSRRIIISYEDFIASLTAQSARKNYGWLKVVGNSMNNAQPIPIEDGDYVLFYKNPKPDIRNVVVTSETLAGSTVIGLLIKRLIKRKGQLFLHSESKNKNPETDAEYEDIKVNNRYQLMGEVLAVAKLK